MEVCLSTETLLEYLEGRATTDNRARVERHASRCDECRRVLSSLARDPEVVTPGYAPTIAAGEVEHVPAERVPAELAAGDPVGRYVVRARLGAGGMGVVYAAHDPELGRDVAIKLLSPGLGSTGARALFEERLRREARALAQLAHPNVVAIHDVGRVGERLFIAMELLEGGTVAQWCRAERRAPRDILERFSEAGRGLAAAHAAGIVHRDIKPENMMLGKDGRVRVVDFGLARTDASDLASPAGESPVGDGALTATGAVMGTPHYMAPEQHRGEEVDARTDQFAFCVALYVALFGVRPFAGDDLASLAESVAAGALREPPSRRGVSRRVWRALRRGMAPERRARFGTLDDLLHELAAPRRSRWIPVAAAGVLGAAALVVARTHGGPTPCEDMAVHLRGVWDAPRATRVAAALRATGAPSADTAARTVTAQLDRYTRAWVAMRGDACRATRVRGDQTDEAMALRMTCLDDRLRDVDALAGQLEHADRTMAEHAVAATYALGSLAPCADVEALRKLGKPPRDPKLVAELRGKLAEARAQENAGHVREGLAAVQAIAPRVAAAAYRPLEAEHAFLEGSLRSDADTPDEAVAALERAVFAAEASGYDSVATRALIELVHIHGTHGKFDDADAATSRATAALERMGGDAGMAADLDYAVAMGSIVRDDLDGAAARLHHALDTWQTAKQPDEVRIAEVLTSLGQVELKRMNGDAATPYLERALAIDERLLGPDHPDLASIHAALGGAAYESAHYDEAADHYQRAIALLERAFGHDNVQIANALADVALVRQWQGNAPDALVAIREAVALDDKLLPAGDPQTASHIVTESDVLEQLHRHADALTALDRALAIMRQLYKGDHQDIADALHSRALIELAIGKLDGALADGREALAMFGRVNPDYPTLELLRTLGKIELARHDPVAALTYLDEAKHHADASEDPYNLQYLDALTGRALVESGRDRAKGIALVKTAYAALAADPRTTEETAELSAWLRAHGLPVK
jgi:tetratricopeptide (TPR) repeat protein